MVDQDVTVKLNVEQGGNAAEGLSRLTDHANRLDQATQRARQGLGSMHAQHQRGGMGGLLEMTGLGGAVTKLSVAAAGAVAAKVALDSVTRVGEIQNQGNLTAAQKSQAMGESLPLGVGAVVKSLREFRDMIDGVNEKLRRQGIKYADLELEHRLGTDVRLAAAQGGAQLFGARARAGALRGVDLARRQGYDRATLAGSQLYGEEQQLVPLRNQAARAAAEAVAAARAERESGGRLFGLEGREDRLRMQQVAAEDRAEGLRAGENFGGPRAKAQRDEAERRHRQINLDLLNVEQEKQAEINRLREAGLAAVEKQAEAGRAQLAVDQARLGILQAREQRTAANAGRLGLMHPMERQFGVHAAEYLKKHGLQNATPEIIAAAQSVAPEWVQKQGQAFGESTEEYKRLRAGGFFGTDTQSLKGLREQAAKLQAQVDVNIHLNEQTVADAIVTKLDRALQKFIDSLQVQAERRLREQQIGRQIQNNQQN